MKLLICIFLGAGLGAVARYGMQVGFLRIWPNYPAGTLAVNVIGCFLMGGLLAWAIKNPMSSEMRAFLAVGLLGGFTTFSAFAGESLEMLQRGAVLPALGYAAASVAGCLASCAAGFALMNRI